MPDSEISFAVSQPAISCEDDARFLGSLSFSPQAPGKLVQAASDGDVEAFCRRLSQHAAGLAGSNATVAAHVLWSRNSFEETDRASRLADLLVECAKTGGKRGRRQRDIVSRLEAWLASDFEDEPLSPFETLGLYEILSNQARSLPTGVLWTLWKTALMASVRFCAELDEAATVRSLADQRLIATGELPWQAGLVFSCIRGAGDLREKGRETLQRELLETTDTDGTPSAEIVDRLALWLAPFIRAADGAAKADVELWDETSAERFQDLIGSVVSFCHADGSLPFATDTSIDTHSLLTLAAKRAGWKKKSNPRSLLLSIESSPSKKRKVSPGNGKASESPAMQSDWSRLALMRPDWFPRADSLAVAHHRPWPELDLSTFGSPLLAGAWELEVSVDGDEIALDEGWNCVCWFSDTDADYLELQMLLADGLRIERQLLLSKRDHYAVLADTVAGAGEARIDYMSRLPVTAAFTANPDTTTREISLAADRTVARAFPLALPQDRVQGSAGAFDAETGRVTLQQASIGGLYAPVVLDWSPQRKRGLADWATLTVAEDGRILKADDVSAHRIRIGNHQLLIYRSLSAGETARTVLGHHTSHETVIGRFDRKGNVDPVLLVE